MGMSETVVEHETVTRISMRLPSMFNVVLFNDDRTTVEFVVLVLMTVFYKSITDASALTMKIHDEGRGVAGTFSFEVATQKRDETIALARANGWPLHCAVEEV